MNYLIAAYAVTIVALVVYGVSLFRERNSLSK
ncbi:MAG: CcmD family protein [Myxococcota bacterium]|jgi:CcmD family protein